MRTEICNECGRSVKMGSGRYVNRIPDLNYEPERKEMGKPFPKGDFICGDCDTEPKDVKASSTEEKWTCNDIGWTGELLIQNKAGKSIAEVFNKKDVPLIKSAPKLLEALKAVYQDIELQNVKGGSDELNLMVQDAIKSSGQ